MKAMKANELIINSGCREEVRTASSELGLAPETELEFIEKVARVKGTGYKNSVYRVIGTDDAVIIRENDGPIDNLYWANVELKKGFFSERRNYAKLCGKLSKKYSVPFEVCLAIGTEEDLYPQIIEAKERFVIYTELFHELVECGINRRLYAIKSVLGEELFNKLPRMGQISSQRLANWLADYDIKN